MKPKGKLALDRKALISFLDTCPDPVGKREIARAFGLRGRGRAILDDLLDGFSHPRLLGRSSRRPLPKVTVVTVSGIDDDGEALAVPTAWRGEATPPRIVLAPGRGPAPAVGDNILVRLRRDRGGEYLATEMHRIAHRPEHLLGVFRRADDGTGHLVPTERSRREEYPVSDADARNSRPGKLVRAEIIPAPPRARITSRLGGGASAIGDIVVHGHDLPRDMPAAAVAEAEAAQPVEDLSRRDDLRDLPLVTVDDADARDFDDAVWAEPAPDGGWHAIVAIADVAWYVRPGSALDRMARERGNSIYLPDRVLPMLPEALSNGLCSLSPHAVRPCLGVHLWLDTGGNLRKHRFVRGLMRSQARLTYDQMQAVHDGSKERPTAAVSEVIAALYGAFESLRQARLRRGTIELELPERRVIFGADGTVEAIAPRPRLDSHRLIEEFMIAANVAAARALEAANGPCLYRVHDLPPADGVDELRRAANALGFHFHGGRRPADFTKLLREVATSPRAPVINTMVLRCQAKAVYAPVNHGHFGLALDRYCHFTSPIRRYATFWSTGPCPLPAIGRGWPTEGSRGHIRGRWRTFERPRAPGRHGRARGGGPIRRRIYGFAHRAAFSWSNCRHRPLWSHRRCRRERDNDRRRFGAEANPWRSGRATLAVQMAIENIRVHARGHHRGAPGRGKRRQRFSGFFLGLTVPRGVSHLFGNQCRTTGAWDEFPSCTA